VVSTPGSGSTFWFEVRLEAARKPSQEVQPAAPAPLPRLSGRVLVAEDNEVNLEVARRMLQGAGLTVDVAVNGREAVERWSASRPDLVLMDVQMPELDGNDATRRIRALEAEAGGGARTPIIALTAHDMPSDHADCLAAGMDGYLAKPYGRRQLLELLQRHLPRGAAPEAAAAAGPAAQAAPGAR